MRDPEPKDVIATIALVVSLISFIVTVILTRVRDKVALKPMLVFLYKNEGGWHIENVGNGPAFDVIFTRVDDHSAAKHVRLPTIAKGGILRIHFASEDNSIVFLATYRDIDERKYTSKSEHDVSKITKGWRGGLRPKVDAGELDRWWHLQHDVPRDRHQRPDGK